MPARARPRAPARRFARAALVAGYLALAGLGFCWRGQPRVFWTIVLPSLVLFIVLGGFYVWRDVCPLAFFGDLGRRLNRGTQRSVHQRLERSYFGIGFVGLAAMLVLRLVATNGDGAWLSGLLLLLALAAAVTNAWFTGKTWCNFFCPVGMVERIYTDPSSLVRSPNSQCARCTACKRSCPDIDQENSYWTELSSGGRRFATYCFPGLVFAFYGYFWLRYGDWEAYFDGRWTRIPADLELAFGAGFFFAPRIPALAAAALTVAVFSAASYGIWRLVEALVARSVPDAERRRHLVLSLAAFSAFCLFYFFAGAPTLRKIPGGTRAIAFITPTLASLVLARRWRRSREGYVKERGAAWLMRDWPFEGPRPSDPAEAFAFVTATAQARDKLLAGYARTLRELLADGIVRESDRRLLDVLRKQFGITPREHDQVLGRLEREQRELLAGAGEPGGEVRVQLESYQAALTEALLRGAPEPEIGELRRAFGVTQAAHEALLERMRGGAGPLLARARRHLEEALCLHAERSAIERVAASEVSSFLVYLLRTAEQRALVRVLDLLETVGGAERVRPLRRGLLAEDLDSRRDALRQLREACPEADALIDRLRALVEAPDEPSTFGDDLPASTALERLSSSADPYLRAGALWLAGVDASEAQWAEIRARAEADADTLVKQIALAARPGSGAALEAPYAERTTVEKMQSLRRISLFAELDPEDLEDLAALASEEIVSPPHALCEQGVVDAGDLMVLLEGSAVVTVRGRQAAGDVEREVAELGANEVVGELALVDGAPRSATVRPRGGPVRILRIPGRAFSSQLLPRERVARALLITLSQRLRRLGGRIAAAEK